MTDKEKSVEKGILARTATYTTKTAKRAQTKVIKVQYSFFLSTCS